MFATLQFLVVKCECQFVYVRHFVSIFWGLLRTNMPATSTFTCSTESLPDEYMKEACMHNLAREVVRRQFDKQFPPQTLEKELEKQKDLLKRLKEQRGITKSQWEDLFPVDKGNLHASLTVFQLNNCPMKNQTKAFLIN